MRRTTRAFVVLCAWLSVAPNSRAAGGFHTSGPSTTSSSHPSTQTRVTRPAPPLQHAPGGIHPHHHHPHPFPFFFATAPIFFGSSLNYGFGYPYGFGSPYGSAMPYGLAESGFAPVAIYAPFYCSLDGLAFQDEATFVRHLHDAHDVPLENALSYAESIGGGRYVFFGF